MFIFKDSQEPVSMWMKNTYIPLDMLFMNAKGQVDYIKVNATPLSLDIIAPPRAEYAVLELNGVIMDSKKTLTRLEKMEDDDNPQEWGS